MPFDGAAAGVPVGPVDARDETPDEARLVVVAEQVVQRQGWQQLLAVGQTQTGSRSGRRAVAARRPVVVATHTAVVGKPYPTVTPIEG